MELLQKRAAGDDGALAAGLRRRKDDLTDLIAEGLLTENSARPQLRAIKERLASLQSWTPGLVLAGPVGIE